MAKDADGEMAYDNFSRMEPKRAHQWFMDGSEVELFPNKKQAVDISNNNSFLGISNSNVSPWGNASGFHTVSGHFTDRLFHTETARTINFDDRDITSVSSGNMNMGRKLVEDPWSNDSTFGLSMSHTLEDPISGLNYSGVRKVKVSQVKYCDSVNILSASMGHPYSRGSNNTLSMVHTYNKADDNTISMGLTYNNRDENNISMGDAFVREDNNLISMGQPCSKGGDNIPIGHSCKGDEATISMGQPFSKGDGSIILMGQTYSKGDQNTISMGQFTQDDHNIISMGQSYIKRDDNTISTGHIYIRRNKTTISMSDNNNLSMGHLYNRECSNIISFGGYDDDTKPAGICSYDLLMAQSPVQISEEVNEKDLVESNGDALVDASKISSSGTVSKKKEKVKISKKDPSNSFPSNVRSLLSTGMLDGVPVKYIAWSREELRGVIRGSGYMCSCQSCNFSKLINAYEFERHAGCKTKHPNNHIYFENGKTIYGIVQELRSTPQNMLFEVIQTITGSPINQKFFRLWKESFLAATSELQRIYGKDEGKLLS